MGIFSRLAQLIKSNLNDLISKSEDPEKMLEQIILDMSNQLTLAKKQVAASIADEKRLNKQYEQEASEASEWERRAMMALKAGNEELAREALVRKREHDELAKSFQEQWEKQKAAVDQLKKALRALNDKIEEAKRKKNVLIARKKRAEAQKSIQETMHGLKDQSAFETFKRMEGKIEQMEAEAEAQADVAEEYSGDVLASKFANLERKAGADDDLEALKRKMGMVPAEAPKKEAGPTRVADDDLEALKRKMGGAPTEAPKVAEPQRVPAAASSAETDELAAALEELEAEQQNEAKKKAAR